MSRVRSRGNVTTELRLARLLRKARLRGWRRNQPYVGNPDFAWPDFKVAVFVDGCFWHGHNCGRNLSPKTNATQWKAKIKRNKERDRRVGGELKSHGWRVVRLWECAVRLHPELCLSRIRRALTKKRRSVSS